MCPGKCVFCGKEITAEDIAAKKAERIDLFGRDTTPSFRYACRPCLDNSRNQIITKLLSKA
jgi:hypothetical protein